MYQITRILLLQGHVTELHYEAVTVITDNLEAYRKDKKIELCKMLDITNELIIEDIDLLLTYTKLN